MPVGVVQCHLTPPHQGRKMAKKIKMANMKKKSKVYLTEWGDVGGKKSFTPLTIAQCAWAISSPKKTAQICRAIREAKDDDERRQLKRGLRCLLFHAKYNGGRAQANVENLTGYLCIDLDDDLTTSGNKVCFSELKNELANDHILNPCLLFRSPSDKLKCVVYVPQLDGVGGDGHTEEFHKWYNAVAAYFFNAYGLLVDTSCRDTARNCYMSHDPAPHLNENGEVRIELDTIKEAENALTWNRICAIEAGRKNGGNITERFHANTRNFTENDQKRYKSKLEAKLGALLVGEDGDWCYNKDFIVTGIGSRTNGTNTITIFDKCGEISGYELKWRVLEVGVLLYKDKNTAQRWVERHFPEARKHSTWTPICESNMRISPKLSVLEWVLRVGGFRYKKTDAGKQ